MLMLNAEQQKFTLKADVNYMENFKALEEMKDFEELSKAFKSDFNLKGNFKAHLPTLDSIMAQKQMSNKAKEFEQTTQEISQEKEGLKKQVEELQSRIQNLLQDKSSSESTQVIDLENKIILLEEEKRQAMEECQASKEQAQKA